MKKILILLILILLNNLQAQEYDIDYFSMVLSKKYNKTVILDKEVVKELKVYGDVINTIDLSVLNLILTNNGFQVFNHPKTVYITKKENEEEIRQQVNKENILKSINIEIPLEQEKVNKICESIRATCTYLYDYNYFVSYPPEVDISILSSLKKSSTYNNTSLKLSIYEINISDMKKEGVDISGFFSAVLNNVGIPISVLGSYGSNFSSVPDYTGIKVSSFFEFLEGQGVSNISTTVQFPLINENTVNYQLGDTQSVEAGTISSTENSTLQKTYKDISTGFNINFTTQYLKYDVYINLDIQDNGTLNINDNGTYVIPNSKNLKTKLVFNNKQKIYYIPFSKSTSWKSDEDNTIAKGTIFEPLFAKNESKEEERQIIVVLEYIPSQTK